MNNQGPILYKNYPAGCTDKELKSAIANYANEILKEKAQTNVVLQCSPLVQLGLSELHGRFAKRMMWASFITAFCSLILSFTALYVNLR